MPMGMAWRRFIGSGLVEFSGAIQFLTTILSQLVNISATKLVLTGDADSPYGAMLFHLGAEEMEPLCGRGGTRP
jgi:hypothetical protein